MGWSDDSFVDCFLSSFIIIYSDIQTHFYSFYPIISYHYLRWWMVILAHETWSETVVGQLVALQMISTHREPTFGAHSFPPLPFALLSEFLVHFLFLLWFEIWTETLSNRDYSWLMLSAAPLLSTTTVLTISILYVPLYSIFSIYFVQNFILSCT